MTAGQRKRNNYTEYFERDAVTLLTEQGDQFNSGSESGYWRQPDWTLASSIRGSSFWYSVDRWGAETCAVAISDRTLALHSIHLCFPRLLWEADQKMRLSPG